MRQPEPRVVVNLANHLGYRMRNSIVTGIILALWGANAGAGSFTVVGPLSAQATGLSQNGRIASGIANASAWRWAKDRDSVTVTGLVSSNGSSPWGQPIGGSVLDANGNEVAAMAYTNSDLIGGPVVIGGYPGATPLDNFLSNAYDVSDSGIAVGLAYDQTGQAIAFRWTASEGMTRLPVNRPTMFSRANGISPDGSTIFGWNDQANGGRTGVMWRNGVVTDLLGPDGALPGEALASNSDGSVIVGASLDNPLTGASEAWRWTAATGAQPIGFIGFFGTAFGFGVSDDGNVVVGASGFGFDRSAVIWTPTAGMQLLSDYAAANGVSIPDGWALATAAAVSADGKTIAGWGFAPDNSRRSFVLDLHGAPATVAKVEAHGIVNWNDLATGPLTGIAVGTPVTMTFLITSIASTELEPGQATRYNIVPGTFALRAGSASETLVQTQFGPGLLLSNDYPRSDGIHLMSAATATAGQSLEFELFNPGGNLFDSDDMDRINRTFGPELFEKIAWNIESEAGQGIYMDLQTVRIEDLQDTIFASGFDSTTP